MKNDTLEYWLDWIERFKAWVHASPEGVYTNSSYHVFDVPYDALPLLAAHFGMPVYEEGKDHRQSVVGEIWHGMSMTLVWFQSPQRKFKYAPVKTK